MTRGPAIRPFSEGDLPALQALRAAAFAPVFAGFRAQVGAGITAVAFARDEAEQAALLARLAGWAAEPSSGHGLLVAEDGGRVVGFCAYQTDTASGLAEIGLNAVAPEAQGRGLGRALYAAALDACREAGARAVTVATGGDEAHAPARRALAAAGFGAAIPAVHLYRLL